MCSLCSRGMRDQSVPEERDALLLCPDGLDRTCFGLAMEPRMGLPCLLRIAAGSCERDLPSQKRQIPTHTHRHTSRSAFFSSQLNVSTAHGGQRSWSSTRHKLKLKTVCSLQPRKRSDHRVSGLLRRDGAVASAELLTNGESLTLISD